MLSAIGNGSSQARQPSRQNLNALTGLRFFAATGVVLYHFVTPALAGAPATLVNIIKSGFTAVSLFFVLSGFVLSYSYLNAAGEMRGSKRSFFISRLARIYPAYFLAFLLAAPTNIHWSLQVNSLKIAIAKLTSGALLVLTLQQAWTPWTAWYWNYPAWSVSVEAFFYLVFPFAAWRLCRLRPRYCLVAAVAMWILALAPPLALVLFKGITGPPEAGSQLQRAIEFTPLLRLPEFLLGALLGRLFTIGFMMSERLSDVLSYVAAAGILLIFSVSPAIPYPLLANGVLLPLFALLIYTLAHGQGLAARLLSLRPIVLLGEASYGIYILQIPVAYVLRIPPPHHSLWLFGMYFAALLATALSSWYLIETPVKNYSRHWLIPRRV